MKGKLLLILAYILCANNIHSCIAQAVKTEIKKVNDGYSLFRNGEPYYIKGAGGFNHFDKLSEYGGNSIRLWTADDAGRVLDEAQKLGLTVTLGLYMTPVHYGMDYSNPALVAEQKERIRKEVLKYKDHPALLMWGVGNEVGLVSYDKHLFRAIQDIAEMIHEVDPNHPTTTMLAGAPVSQVKLIKRLCPDIDVLSINAFKEVPTIYRKIEEARWKKPYLISEYGPTGYWESSTTSWGAFLEENSSQKALACSLRYAAIKSQKNCVGSYLFLWGHKQERTSTLFSLIHESGHLTETLDVMEVNWKGKSERKNLAPRINKVVLDGKEAKNDIKLHAEYRYKARVQAIDPDQEKLTYYWEILHETTDLKNGEGERKPDWIPGIIKETNSEEISFDAPEKPGAYRLFVYVYDNHNHVATANIPFLVEK